MLAGIEKRLFEGDCERGKIPKYSLNDLDKELFRYVIFVLILCSDGQLFILNCDKVCECGVRNIIRTL